MGENYSHGSTLTNIASQKSNKQDDYLRDNKRKRRKSGDKILQTEALLFRTAVFSLEVLASRNLFVVTALH